MEFSTLLPFSGDEWCLNTETLHKHTGIRVTVGITCSLSALGSLLIIISYVLFKDLRTSTRLILVHLSIADLGVAVANLFGEAYRFDKKYNRLTLNFTSHSVHRLCLAQAFFAHFCTISSVLWTMALAAFMYIVVMKLKSSVAGGNLSFVRFSYLFCYGIALLVNVWMISTNKLGFSPFNTAGWCGTIINKIEAYACDPSDHEHKFHIIDYMAAVFGYDIWIVLTFVFIIVTYLVLHFYMRHERKKSAEFAELIRKIDYKFVIIPVAFVLLRLGSLVHNIIYVYMQAGHHIPHPIHTIIHYWAGIGDSGQGALNAVLFVIFTKSVRQKITNLCCGCCIKGNRFLLVNGSQQVETEESTDEDSQGSPLSTSQSPLISKKPSVVSPSKYV